MKKRLATAALIAFAMPAFAQDSSIDTPGIDSGTTLGEVTKDSIQSSGGRAHGAHAANPPDINGDDPGREGLANIGDDLSDTINAIK
ncbi:hypothetical protein AB0T83_04440 [Fluviibacterium sp. DFM31]|uniref:Uncharacterized protein n=1 Tax=Meridianimarinicoccus marinus TaxID=3231483 RepID=A0ABV3L387_9RHOB